MNDREYCDHAAALAAETVGDRFAHLAFGAASYEGFGPGVVLFFGRGGAASGRPVGAMVAKLREFLAIEEVGIRELGAGDAADGSAWAILAESRRDVEYCRRLVRKAAVESSGGRPDDA